MEVIGSGDTSITVTPGGPWPAPYRGSKYTVQGGKGLTLVGWKRNPLGVQANPFPDQLARYVRAAKGGNGSFRITAHGAIITKVAVRGGSAWQPQYLGKYDGDLRFDGVENSPEGLQLGMYWTGLPFVHGEFWRVSPHFTGDGHLHWSSHGWTHPSTRPYPQLIEHCLAVRPSGGRIYITESGSIWMNVPDHDLADNFRATFQGLQQAQLEHMKQRGLRAALRLLVERIQATGCRPIYVGQIADFDHGKPPWTSFDAEPPVESPSEFD
jgi:hypothetical protein